MKLIDQVKEYITKVVGDLEPDDDIMPVLFLRHGDEVTVAGIDPSFMNTIEDKDKLALAYIPIMVMQTKAEEFAFVTAAWTVKLPPERKDEMDIAPSEHPDRVEIIMINTGDSEHQGLHSVVVDRHESSAPTLQEWVAMDTDGEVTGRMFDSIRDAMMFNRYHNQELFTEIMLRAQSVME